MKNYMHRVQLASLLRKVANIASLILFMQVHKRSVQWSYLARTISNIGDLFPPLEEAIRFQLLPAITGRDAFSDLERDLFALPTRMGELGITNLILEANDCYVASREITAPLSMLIVQQSNHFPNIIIPTRQDKARDQTKEKTATSKPSKISEGGPLSPASACNGPEPREGCFTLAIVLPLSSEGFALHKSAFRDALCLRYGWRLKHLPTHCRCGKDFSVEHAFTCS